MTMDKSLIWLLGSMYKVLSAVSHVLPHLWETNAGYMGNSISHVVNEPIM